MTQRALLIGAQTNGLQGVDNDVEAMARALEPRGFQTTRLTGSDASRDGILDAYRKLVADARHGDACVVYYSGHGGLLRPPAGERAADSPRNSAGERVTEELRPDLQFIVPTDYHDSTDDDFRGITGVELSVLLAQLTTVTPNATVVLDCCHAAHMSRQAAELRVKALLRQTDPHHQTTYDSVRRHVERVVAEGLPVVVRDPYSNPHAVRMVACAPQQSAWEGANGEGVHMGLFTDALSRMLIQTQNLRVNWLTLMDAVRRTVQDFVPAQRPEAEGPAGRQLFDTTDPFPPGTLPVVVTAPGRIRLLGAPLLGVRPGDEFAVLPAEATGPDDGLVLGTAIVDELEPMSASAELRLSPGLQRVPEDARAHRTATCAPALPVRLPDGHPGASELSKAVTRHSLVRAADPGEEAPITVEVDARGLFTVHDDLGPLHEPYPPTPSGIGRIAANLQCLAQAAALRRLAAERAAPFDHRVTVEWGRVRGDGTTEPFPETGALVFAHPHERIYFRLRNDGADPVYVSLIDIGISARIGVLTAADPSGIRIAAGATYTYGWDGVAQRMAGVEVTWPATVDRTFARPETVLVLIYNDPVDVSVLERDGVRGAGHPRGTMGSALERLLAQVATGGTREVGRAPDPTVRYAAVPIDFMVSPTAPPQAEVATFLVDDRPAEPVRLLSPRGALPGRVAVRITDLVVHRNRAFGDADIRLDSVVLTGGTADRPAYEAKTLRLPGIADGDRLPLDDVLIYHGPAVDFLDIAIWVSRDTKDSLALGDLLSRRLNDPAVQAAGAQLAGLALAAPHATAAVAVAGACAVVVNTAYLALCGAVGSTIGLYRTSLLAQEQFGIGRHRRHPQDFSFTFSIEPVA